MLLMQGQQRPCQDSICSMLACLWPWATALENGSVLEAHSLFRVCLKNSLLGSKWDYTLLRCKEVLVCPPKWAEERQDQVCVSVWFLDGTASGPLSAVPSSGTRWLCHSRSSPSAIVRAYTGSIVQAKPFLGWSDDDFSFTDAGTMDGSSSLQAVF